MREMDSLAHFIVREITRSLVTLHKHGRVPWHAEGDRGF